MKGKKRKNVLIPIELVTDNNLPPSAKIIYAVLKSFQKGKPNTDSAASVILTHAEIIEKSNFSKHTVAKALNLLERNRWIEQQRNSGSANRYIFTAPNKNA
jgi:DNA-binding MarR family transcriptional regulator